MGKSEHFEYHTGETTYINPSGIATMHYYNADYLETKVVNPDAGEVQPVEQAGLPHRPKRP